MIQKHDLKRLSGTRYSYYVSDDFIVVQHTFYPWRHIINIVIALKVLTTIINLPNLEPGGVRFSCIGFLFIGAIIWYLNSFLISIELTPQQLVCRRLMFKKTYASSSIGLFTFFDAFETSLNPPVANVRFFVPEIYFKDKASDNLVTLLIVRRASKDCVEELKTLASYMNKVLQRKAV